MMVAAGGRRRLIDLPDPPLEPNGEPQDHMVVFGGLSPAQFSGVVLLFILLAAILIASLLCHICKKAAEEEQQQATTSSNDAAVPEVVAVDMPESSSGQQADGTCSVCLGELAGGGKAVRMLMPCKHCFHAACVDKWLRKSATCPICRAPTVAPKAGRRRRT